MKGSIRLSDIDVDVMKQKGYFIIFPRDGLIRIKLAGFLYNKAKYQKAQTVLDISKNMARSGFYKYLKIDFQIKPRFVNTYRKNENKEIRLRVENKKGVHISTIKTTLRELATHKTIENVVEVMRPKLSIQKAKEIRDNFDTQETVYKPESIEEIEQVTMEICQRLASGRYSLVESCNYYRVSIFDFMRWYYQHDTVKTIYEEAFQISNFINGSTMLTQANKLIMEILQNGATNSNEIKYSAVKINDTETRFIESEKTVRTREVTLGELIRLIEIFKKNIAADKPMFDEFADMSDEELLDYIKEHKNLLE